VLSVTAVCMIEDFRTACQRLPTNHLA